MQSTTKIPSSASASRASFSPGVLELDCEAEVRRLIPRIREITAKGLQRRALVVGVSGGIDSSVCVVLAARALGPDRVRAVLMPERESSPSSLQRGRAASETAGVSPILEDITAPLEALGCYRRRDESIRALLPDYRPGDRFKITLSEPGVPGQRLSFFNLVVEISSGNTGRAEVRTVRLPVDAYLAIVAATNLKQRVRTTVLYTHADALNAAVLGTPNRLEYDQGFFVKGGDGLADLKPIAHLYKTQVYALARYLGLPNDICEQTPSTDTYSLPQTQQEFYFSLPYAQMDLALYAYAHDIPAATAAPVVGVPPAHLERIYHDISGKRRASRRLLAPALLVEDHDWGRDGTTPGTSSQD